MLHRDSQKRFYIEKGVYFVTTKTKQNYPFFKNEILCELFINQIRLSKQIKSFHLFGFAILYDHVHLMIRPSDKDNISKVMFSIKKQFAHDCDRVLGFNETRKLYTVKIKNDCGNKQVDCTESVHEGEQTFVRLHESHLFHNKENTFHSMFLQNLKNKYASQSIKTPFKFQWQKSFHDHYIRNNEDFVKHLNYIYKNPQNHNLPQTWPYVSYNYPNLIDF